MPSNRVWPSGCAWATMSALRLPPAPARFSTRNGRPICSERFCATTRATKSTEPSTFAGNVTAAKQALADSGFEINDANRTEVGVVYGSGAGGQMLMIDAYRTLNEKALTNLKAKGMVVNEITPAEQARMLDKVKPVYDKNVPTIGPEAVTIVLDSLKKARGG